MSASQSLTPAQISAIENWEKEKSIRCFMGATTEFVVDIFVSINAMKETDPEKANKLEEEMFVMCGVKAPVIN